LKKNFVRQLSAGVTALLAISVAPAQAILSPSTIPAVFSEMLLSPILANPSMILIDAQSGEVVYEKNANSPRKPASTLKIFSAAATLRYMDPNEVFRTSVSLGTKPKTVVIQGSYDPWISYVHNEAVKMKRTSLPRLAFNTLSAVKKANNGSARGLTIEYSELNSRDVANFKAFFKKRGYTPIFKRVSSSVAFENADTEIVSSYSLPVSEILEYMMLWSDNVLADRLAKLASKRAGNAFSEEGIAITFAQVLLDLGIDPSRMIVADGSGLSRENRVSAKTMAELLLKLRKDPQYENLYTSLPVGGVSGTLRNRFLTTAPGAVGLVHAKTGTLNGTVSLAGYIESGEREYIFVTVADKIPRGNRASDRARALMDRILGRIAAPTIAVVPAIDSTTVTS
jgi:D-alanyl-D-alanine carboxypeptidase